MYAIFDGPRLLYVGSSVDLKARCSQHGIGRGWNRPRRRWSFEPSISVRIALTRRAGDHLAREFRLIQRLRPPLNTIHACPR